MTEEELQKEVENNPVVRFVKSRTFYVILVVLSVIGIAVALLTGGLKTSRVPSVSDQVKPWYSQ